ncbi:TPA: hypothetical protein F8R87_01865 [Legionella pneumophila]|nr:hypothetical protein [Legionella pneumophila]
MKTTPCNGRKKFYAFESAPRCLAKTRRGKACQSPTVRGKRRCRLHGCGRGSGAPKGNQYALTHGQTTAQAKAFRLEVKHILRESHELANSLS